MMRSKTGHGVAKVLTQRRKGAKALKPNTLDQSLHFSLRLRALCPLR
jgi:hypothetical protein